MSYSILSFEADLSKSSVEESENKIEFLGKKKERNIIFNFVLNKCDFCLELIENDSEIETVECSNCKNYAHKKCIINFYNSKTFNFKWECDKCKDNKLDSW